MREVGYKVQGFYPKGRWLTMAWLVTCAVVLAACGGGGGADAGSSTATAQAAETPAPAPAKDAPGLTLGNDSFYFVPDQRLAAEGALDTVVAGGQALFAAWDPNNPLTALKPGMKVMFFGTAQACPLGVEGPLTAVSDARLAVVATLTGLGASATTAATRWEPSGNAAGCDDAARDHGGASAVFLNPSAAGGAVGMLTTSGVQADGASPFLGPFGPSGQSGSGANIGIAGTFVGFRQALNAADPVQPWSGGAVARLRSVQTVGNVSAAAGPDETVQAKQQMMATYLNTACMKELHSSGKPCQVQYLMNTAIVRSGVTDWGQVPWFQNGGLVFDAAQGGIPVIDGPLKVNGTVTLDQATGLSLFTSQGTPTQHAPFAALPFDATISFGQLLNALRMTAAKANQTAIGNVTDGQIAALWGSGWNDRSKWVLLSSEIGQEVYNPRDVQKVEIAGGFTSFFAGTQP